MMMDYDELKLAARKRGVPVTDLIALSPSNDPFYAGTPGDTRLARWFSALWHRFGYSSGVHIRRMHYQIVSQNPPVLMPDSKPGDDKPYENTERCWDVLNAAAKQARYLRLVRADAFVDRRNPPPTVYMADLPDEPWVGTTGLLPDRYAALPDFPEPPTYTLTNYDADGRQRYLVELVCEKSTMNDVLLPFCQEHGFNLVTGLGELSITAALEASKRIFRLGKPARIFYVSDFDPAGASMPVAFSRKLEYFVRQAIEDGECDPDVDVRVDPVVLTADQVRRYSLPRTPIKDSESRGAKFEARFGAGAVELDALEALYPGQLVRILDEVVEPYYDADLASRIRQERRRFERDLVAEREGVLRRHFDEIAVLRANYEAARAQAEELLARPVAQIREFWQVIEQQLRDAALDPAEYPLPDAEEAAADYDEWSLYDSRRRYFDQVDIYREHQGRAS